MAVYLIVNADDFGLSPGVTRGIVDAFAQGIVSSASMMANMPGFTDAVRAAAAHPNLSIGLHFNLTYGRPLSDPRLIPSLVREDGAFHTIADFLPSSEEEIRTELAAQWSRLISVGIRPSHLDSHHLLHQQYPAVHKVMAEWAYSRGVPLRKSQLADAPVELKPAVTGHIVLDTYDEPDSVQRLIGHLRALPHGTAELACHPGYADDGLKEISGWSDMREAELATLCHPAVKQAISDLGIRLIDYRSLQGALEEASAGQAASAIPLVPGHEYRGPAGRKNKKARARQVLAKRGLRPKTRGRKTAPTRKHRKR